MPGRKTSPEIQWVIVRLSDFLDDETIAMCCSTSTRTVNRILAHFREHGTIPNKKSDRQEGSGNLHPYDDDAKNVEANVVGNMVDFPARPFEPQTQLPGDQPFVAPMGYPWFPGGYTYPPFVVSPPYGATVQICCGPYTIFVHPPTHPTYLQWQLNPSQPSPHDVTPPAFHLAATSHSVSQSSAVPCTHIPGIVEWFAHLDRHEGRNQDGIVFAPLGPVLKHNCLSNLAELNRNYLPILELQELLEIDIGTAALIMRYADEDREAWRMGRLILC